jgi:hypothetical protein
MTDYVLYQIRIDATILCRIRPELFDVLTLLGNDVREEERVSSKRNPLPRGEKKRMR